MVLGNIKEGVIKPDLYEPEPNPVYWDVPLTTVRSLIRLGYPPARLHASAATMSPELALAKLRRIQHHTLAINGAQPVPVAIKLINERGWTLSLPNDVPACWLAELMRAL